MDEKTGWAKWVAIFISSLSLFAFIWSARTNQRILSEQQKWREDADKTNQELIRAQQEWQKASRKNDIASDIRISSDTYLDSISPENATIIFENIGKGIAQDIFLWIGDGKELFPMVFHNFDPVSGGPSQNYIRPGQKLKFGISALMFSKKRSLKTRSDSLSAITSAIFTFYFSYFDVDGNQYLLVITEHPAGVGGEMLVNVRKGVPLDSMLLSLPRSKRYIYTDKDIRDQFRWVKRELAK